MEALIHESQHADEYSERHELEMFPTLLEKIKIMSCKGINAFFIS